MVDDGFKALEGISMVGTDSAGNFSCVRHASQDKGHPRHGAGMIRTTIRMGCLKLWNPCSYSGCFDPAGLG